VSGATTSAGSFATAITTADRLLWLTDYAAAAQAGGTGPVPARLARGIRVEHLGFSYPGEPAPVLTDVNLDLPAGSTVALVGENGAGKSTLVKLLTGMYRPSSGKITVDGADLASIGPARWRASTTGAFQDFVQFHMTLGDGVGAATAPHRRPRRRARYRHAGGRGRAGRGPARRARHALGPWVGGRSLSQGQWQRLALARGLMRQAPLLVVLDEPTASLDAPSEAALFTRYAEAARRLGEVAGTITVLVSHRFSSVHMADQIIVLDGGRVAETGDHAALLARPGIYAELFTLQAEGYLGR
jgi:ATP-binding cassette subfamily B protein